MIQGFNGLVFDGHTDVPTRLLEAPADLDQPCADRHIDLPRLRAGGVDALVFALYVPAELSPAAGLARARAGLAATQARLRPGGFAQARGVAEVRNRVAAGEVAVLLGLENGRPLTVPGALDELDAGGVRIVTLTHVGTHEWCDASTDTAVHGGLSPAGEGIVRDLVDRGIALDVSHVSDAAVEHVLRIARAPIAASHSSARALCDVPRNLPDELVRAIAGSGGIVMANAYPAFLAPHAARANAERLALVGPALAALSEAYADDPASLAEAVSGILQAHPLPAVPLATFVDHVLYLVGLVGPDHVGIGSDFDGISEVPVGFEHPGCFPALAAALVERGLDAAEVSAILGGNALRMFAAIEAAAG